MYGISQNGFIKEFDLGTQANIFPIEIGGDSTKGKCDYNYVGENSTTLRTLLVGSYANSDSQAGVGCFYSYVSVSDSWTGIGFYTIKEID